MRRLALAASVLALSGCLRMPDPPVAPAALKADVPLGPPPYLQNVQTDDRPPLEQATSLLSGADTFSFVTGSDHVLALRLMLASEAGRAALATVALSRTVAGQLYGWCGLKALGNGDADRLAATILRDGDEVVVFDADLHHRRKAAWVVRRATGTGFCESLAPPGAVDPWVEAEKKIVRLRPSAFPDVPRVVRDDLERRGCRIPQTPSGGRWQNLVPGRFTGPRAMDWAALCSRAGSSSILVYPNGTAQGVLELSREQDRGYLQQGADAIVYSRQISPATPAYIRVKNHPSLVPGLPRFDHDGITDAFVERASTVWFRSAGRWLKLLGAD